MQVEWTEGEWKDGCPVEPDRGFVWIVVEGRPRPIPKRHESIDFLLLSYDSIRRDQDSNAPYIRWWWAPLEEPSNLPEGCEGNE